MLKGTLQWSLSKKDASELRHLQDPENSLHKRNTDTDLEDQDGASEERNSVEEGVAMEKVQVSVVKSNENENNWFTSHKDFATPSHTNLTMTCKCRGSDKRA